MMVQEIIVNIQENSREVKVKKSYGLFLFCFNLLVSILILPIVGLDLYYYLTDESCKKDFTISIGDWLSVSGYVNLGTVFYIYIYTTILSYYLDSNEDRVNHKILNRLLITNKFILIIFHTFWIVFGFVIFFRFTGGCKPNIYYYILIRLIYKSFVISFYLVFESYQIKNK